MGTSIVNQKRALRAEIRQKRHALSFDERTTAEKQLSQHLRALVDHHHAQSLGCFLSTPEEPATSAFLNEMTRQRQHVLVPVSRADGQMDWAELTSASAVSPGLFRIPEPDGPRLPPKTRHALDILFIPAAAISRTGMRLGWGRGYFDRALADLPPTTAVYAVVYPWEILDTVPIESHDRAVTGVVTPDGVTVFSPQ